MWNYYVHNGNYQGYNIGFDPVSLLKSFEVDPNDNYLNAFTVYYGPIIYDAAAQEKAIIDFASQMEKRYNRGNYKLGYLMVEIRKFVETEGYFFKSKAFEAENEFRIMICISDDRIPLEESSKYSGEYNKKIFEDICVKNGVVIPYLSIREALI